jgi:phosphatidylserine/phosphatidylglycerophosphate/cardiolipin synthase-like enzyme
MVDSHDVRTTSKLCALIERRMNAKHLFAAGLLGLVLILSRNVQAQERLCDSSFEDCRAPLWALIDAETAGIDVAFWFMQDTSLATKLINRHKAGVPVRVIVDPRANADNAGNAQILDQLKAAGIPMRFKLTDGILHWKMMLFAGQNRLEFSGGNFSSDFFVPQSPFMNYIDEAVYFTDDLSLVQSFKKRFDDLWTDSVRYGNFANISGPLTRRYPTFAVDPQLNFPPSVDSSQDFFLRTAANFNKEARKIDIIMYRITNQQYTDTTLAAVKRGIPVRLIHEPNEYRNPARQWDAWNVDRLFVGGVQIKMRKHLGLNHEKAAILHGQAMVIFGSSNWTGPSTNFQEEHNYFTTKAWFFQWFVNHFDRKWNSTTENEPFMPLPPGVPAYLSPSNAAVGLSTTIKLEWEGGPWAHKYDIFLGTQTDPPLLSANVSTVQSGAVAGQPLLDSGSVDDGVKETFTIPVKLQPGTKYFWRVVGKTMAGKTATGPVWSFTTAGTAPAPTPTPTPTPNPLQLVLEQGGPSATQAAALDAILHVRDQFVVNNSSNLMNEGFDQNTRVLIFVTNLQLLSGEPPSAVIVNLVDSSGLSQNLPAEAVRPVTGLGITQVIFRLPSNLPAGVCTIKVLAHGLTSNSGTIRIRI